MIRDRLNALNAETERLWAAQVLAPQLICEAWTAEDLGEVIRKAVFEPTDTGYPHWPTVARKVAEAIGLKLSSSITHGAAR